MIDVEDVRAKLEARKRKYLRELDSLAKDDPTNDPDRINDNASIDTDAAELVDHERVTVVSEQIKENINRIDQALERIELGKWGSCGDCGKAIEEERLFVDPSVVSCASCAMKIEKEK